jgi:hypothetical protein
VAEEVTRTWFTPVSEAARSTAWVPLTSTSYISASSRIGLRMKARWTRASISCLSSSALIAPRSRTSALTYSVFGHCRVGGFTSTSTISSVSSRPESSSIRRPPM